MNLREFARGQECDLRISGVCSYDTTKVVLCHLPTSNLAGMGQKMPDEVSCHGCFECHQVIDGRVKTDLTPVQLDCIKFHAMARTQYKRSKVFKLVPL